MFTGPLGAATPNMEALYILALLNQKENNSNNNKRVELCKTCGASFTTNDSREFCSTDCRKSA